MPVTTDAIVVSDIAGDTLVARVVPTESVGPLVCLDCKCNLLDGGCASTMLQLTQDDAMALAEWIRGQFVEEVQA